MNVPVVEQFAASSPFLVRAEGDEFYVLDERDAETYSIGIPAEPEWYGRQTTSGIEMSRIGVLQGTYLGVYISNRCMYWALTPQQACKFCTTGKNLGENEESRKAVADVVEVALAAKEQSGSVFTHFNTGYHFEDLDNCKPIYGVTQAKPFVEAVRKHVGGFIGVQAVPLREADFHHYDDLIESGADHFSFCYEFEDPETFEKPLPRQGGHHGTADVLRRHGVHGKEARTGTGLWRNYRRSGADRSHQARASTGSSTLAPSRPSASSGRRSEARWKAIHLPIPKR